MGRASGLEDELHGGLANVQVDSFADVLHVEQIRSAIGDQLEQAGERSRTVGQARE